MSAISSMNVRTNISSLQAHRQMREVSSAQTNAAKRLASGYRLNSAADDPAGMAISDTITSQIMGLDQASVNAQDAISLIQTAEGGMQGIGDKLHRIRELLVQAANDTNVHDEEGKSDRAAIQLEIDQMLQGINDMALRNEFNTMALIDGRWAETGARSPGHESAEVIDDPYVGGRALHLQIGANALQNTYLSIGGMTTHHLGLTQGPPNYEPYWNVLHESGANISPHIELLQASLDYLNGERAKLGSVQVRLEHTKSALDVTSSNLSDARSRIRDTDVAKEMMDFTKMNMLFQTGTAMLAHGNRLPENVLQLLQT